MHVLPLTTKTIRDALSVLETGGIVMHATETCYGIACDLTNPTAVTRLFALKKRPLDQPVSVLFSSIEQAKQYVLWSTETEALAKKYLPGPLTLILPLHPNAPTPIYTVPLSQERRRKKKDRRPTSSIFHLPSSNATIGIRISSHPTAQKLVKRFGKPLSTTSANIHRQPTTYSPEEIIVQFPDTLADVLLLNEGTLPHSPPSTIIDLTGPYPREVRRGTTITPVADK